MYYVRRHEWYCRYSSPHHMALEAGPPQRRPSRERAPTTHLHNPTSTRLQPSAHFRLSTSTHPVATMDPVSAVGLIASVGSLIDLSVRVIGTCKSLIETARDAPRDLRAVLVEISSLNSALENLRFLAGADAEFARACASDTGIGRAIEGCRAALEDLVKELGDLAVSKAGRREALKMAVGWTWKEGTVTKLLGRMLQFKSTITLGLLGQTA